MTIRLLARLPQDLNLKPFAAVVGVALLLGAGLATYESRTFDWPPYVEQPPELSFYGRLRSLAIFALSGLILWGLQRTGRGRRHLACAQPSVGWAGLTSSALALTFVGVFLWSPALFNRLALEDGPVEWASAALLLLCCAVFCAMAMEARRAPGRLRAAGLALAFAAGCFVIAMEELSWMQRVIGFETPAFLSRNFQNEANLHNLSTDITENIYYLCAFVFLIGLPYLCEAWRLVPEGHWLSAFAPGRRTALVAAPLVGFNYDMWNVIPIQTAFFLTVLILADYIRESWRGDRAGAAANALVLLAVILPQGVFLASGGDLVRRWDPTEYKELFIPLALFVYAVGAAVSLRRLPR